MLDKQEYTKENLSKKNQIMTRKNIYYSKKEKHQNTKEVYTDGSKSIKKKIGFAAVFGYITRRGALPEEAFNHTAIKIVSKMIHKREVNND